MCKTTLILKQLIVLDVVTGEQINALMKCKTLVQVKTF